MANIVPQQYAEVLNSVVPMTDEFLTELGSLLSRVILQKGEYFVREGDIARELAFVESGLLRAFFTSPDGVEYNKTFFPENTFAFGFASAILNEPSVIEFQALEDSVLWVVPFREVRLLFPAHRCFETAFRLLVEMEWIKKEQRELRLVLNTAEERYEYFAHEYPGLEHRMAQYHIASHLGVTPVQLSRIRKQRMDGNRTS